MAKTIAWLMLAALCVCGCPKRDQVPETAYDPDLIEAARAAQEEQEQARREAERQAEFDKQRVEEEEEGECSRDEGGCRGGYVCWDSYFCKSGDQDQCSQAGDKKCHKKCQYDVDCPSDMPYCREKPIFHGDERGVLEKFCVQSRD